MTSKLQTQPEVKASWIAIVYRPQLESPHTSTAALRLGAPVAQRQTCHPIHLPLGFEKENLPGERGLAGSSTRTIFLSPGATLGVSKKDWEDSQGTEGFKKFIQPKVDLKIIQVFSPSKGDGLEPGYRCFDEEDALVLVQETLHEELVDKWAVGDDRKSVMVAASLQKAELIRLKEAMKAS